MASEEKRRSLLYEIAETDVFLKQVSILIGSIKRWDEIKETIDLELASDPLFTRDPALLNRVPGTTLYGITIRCFPPLTLFYSVDEGSRKLTLVEIHGLQ
jgi:hypothetical protein